MPGHRVSLHVFISYSRRDGDWADALAAGLIARGVRVWIDQSSIPASVPWREEIQHAIRGSMVVAVVDSPAFRSSPSCADELNLARSAARPVIALDASTVAPSDGMERVAAAVAGLGPDDLATTELLARASRWIAGGRSGQALSRGRVLRIYNRSLRGKPHVGEDWAITQFIGASKRRRVQRVLLSTMLITGFLVLLGLPRALDEGSARLVDTFERQQGHVQELNAAYDQSRVDPQAGLSTVLDLLGSSGSMDSYEIDLTSRVLDLRLPEPATGDATALPADLTAESPAAGWSARTDDARRTVIVADATGDLALRIERPAEIRALAWDPEGANLAVADATGVGIYDIVTGARWSELIASAGVQGLAYVGPHKIAAELADGKRAVWNDRAGETIASDADWWFMDAALAPDGRTGLVSRRGEVIEVDPSGTAAAQVAQIEHGNALSITASPGGWLVGVQGVDEPNAVWDFPFGGGEGTELSADGCVPRDLTWNEKRGLVAACGVDYATWDGKGEGLELASSGMVALEAVASLGDDVVLAGGYAEFYLLPEGAKEPQPFRLGMEVCWGGARTVVTVPAAGIVFASGAGFDSGCLERLTVKGSDVETDHFPFGDDGGNEARAMAVSKSGDLVAVGSSSGAVYVYSSDLLNLVQVAQVSGQEIRGLAFAPDGDALIAVTRGGEVINLCLTARADRAERVATIRSALDTLPRG